MEKQLKELKAKMAEQLKASRKEKKELQQECQSLREKLTAVSSSNAPKKLEHAGDFWANIWNNCSQKTGPFGTDSIKTWIKTGKMTIYDTDRFGRTLLGCAANYGAYDLAQFLINNVTDIYMI